MRQMFKRVAVEQPIRQQLRPKTMPAPTRGLIANENLIMASPGGATLLDNWFPTQTGIRLRGGSKRRATIGTGTVLSAFSYVAGPARKLFASSLTSIFEITSVGSPTVPPAAAVTGQTSGYYSTIHMVNASGNTFLFAVNGTDDPLTYNGSTWTKMNASSTPAFTGATGLSQVWKYRNRLFFVQGGSLDCYFLPINAVGGALSKIPLAGIFQRGGAVLFGGTWSMDAGDGMDDKCVFVTTEGEVAVFEGADPSNAADWSIVGRYDISRPLGKNGFMTVGGDLLILTEDGIVPISQVTSKDPTQLSLAAVSRPIEPLWKEDVLNRRGKSWEIVKWAARNMAIVAPPASAGQDHHCWVVNLQTGAWARYTGWDTQCLVVFDDWAHFGTSDGRILQCELTGEDDGEAYVCTAVSLFDHLDAIGYTKTVHMARSTYLASQAFTDRLTVATDYKVDLPAAPNSGASFATAGLWDAGLWDVATWDDSATIKSLKTKWGSIGRSGFSIAWQVQVTCQGPNLPDAELLGIDLTYEVGAMVV